MEFKLKSEFNFHLKKHYAINQKDLNDNNIINNQQNFNLVVNNIQNFQEEKNYLNLVTNLYNKQYSNFNLNNKTFGNNFNENNLIESNNNNKTNDFYSNMNKNFNYQFNFVYNVNRQNYKNLMIIKEINYNICCI